MRQFRWGDLDLENRPLSYRGGTAEGASFTTADVTVIAFGWVEEDEVHCWAQTKDPRSRVRMLKAFLRFYNEADGITGHNIIRHDLPILNSHLIELGLPPLAPKTVCDTYSHFIKRKDISASQSALAQMLNIPEHKMGVGDVSWRSANRLEPEGIEIAKARCIQDVIQHKQLRAALIEGGYLRAPRVWRP